MHAHTDVMKNGWRMAAAGMVAVAVAVASPCVANADNSNNNTNNNDVTNIGDPSDMSDRSAVSTSWPPGDLSWPPSDIVNENGGGSEATKPIVPVTAP